MTQLAASTLLPHRFLRGELKSAEREEFEAQLLADPDLFQETLLAEDDLLDDVAQGNLPASALRSLATLPDLKQRLAFAQALATITRTPVAPPEAQAEQPAWPAQPPQRLARTRWLALAALLTLALGLGLLWPRGPAPTSPPLQFVLSADVVRSNNAATPTLTIPQAAVSAAKPVELWLEVAPGDAAARFDAQLLAADGRLLRAWDGLSPRSLDASLAVVLTLPAADLLPGPQALVLNLDSTPAYTFAFTVVHR